MYPEWEPVVIMAWSIDASRVAAVQGVVETQDVPFLHNNDIAFKCKMVFHTPATNQYIFWCSNVQ
jgi:hypothetical protein